MDTELNERFSFAIFEELEPRFLLSAVSAGDPDLLDYQFEFSLDIGSDTELSDPNADGDEGFDPGDVYWWQGAPVTPPTVPGGRDGFKDDALIFGFDPYPDPPDPNVPPMTAVPVGKGTVQDYSDYFDLDGHDQIDFSLVELLPPDEPLMEPIGIVPSQFVFPAQYLAISFDDDGALGWPGGDVPVTASSPAGMVYGTTGGQDEIIGVTLTTGGAPYSVVSLYPIADELTVHQDLTPNPDTSEADDDDVDSLDIVGMDADAYIWLFSADHEAHMGLDPGDIYETTIAGGRPKLAVDDVMHLGISDDTDIDAFELAYVTDADGQTYLAVLFSVDDDDPLTIADESGGLDPSMIYASYMTGYSFPILQDGLGDDIDGLTNWQESMEQGEPEDELDFGDAPDAAGAPMYPTLLASNGARHTIMPNYHLGNSVDPEVDGQPNAAATGDDNDGNDDEDGVTFISAIVPGFFAGVDVFASAAGFLDAWIDFNGDGDWNDAGEQIFASQALLGGLNSLNYAVPTTAVAGAVTYARFRFSSTGGLSPTGAARDGEVEDYEIDIEQEEYMLDYGDAPDRPYPTLIASNGAAHGIVPGYFLGNSVDGEPDGQPNATATGDDGDGNNDDDGVVFTSLMVQGNTATVDVFASGPGFLDAWIDFDGNGSWADAGEQIFMATPLGAGLNSLKFLVGPGPIGSGFSTFARFRFSSNSTGLPFTGTATDGEVEDYEVQIHTPAKISGQKYWDVDADGVWDAGEPTLAGFVIYVDFNHNSTRDGGEPYDTTDASGNYQITGLPPGIHTIAEESQTYWTQTAPVGGTHSVPVSSGSIVGGKDFGNWMTGDYDFDQDVDDLDLDLMMAAIRGSSTNMLYDLSGDSSVTRADLDIHVQNLVFIGGSSSSRGGYYGDANLSGYIDDDDLSLLLTGWHSGMTWNSGNFIDNDASIDPTVDDDDLSLLLTNWHQGTPPPSAAMMEMETSALAASEPIVLPTTTADSASEPATDAEATGGSQSPKLVGYTLNARYRKSDPAAPGRQNGNRATIRSAWRRQGGLAGPLVDIISAPGLDGPLQG